MKSSSKLDQIRAMREAKAAFSIAEALGLSPVVLGLDKTQAQLLPRALRKSATAIVTVSRPESDTVSDTVSWLAPAGQCPHCDKRRAQLQATMKKRRAKKP